MQMIQIRQLGEAVGARLADSTCCWLGSMVTVLSWLGCCPLGPDQGHLHLHHLLIPMQPRVPSWAKQTEV